MAALMDEGRAGGSAPVALTLYKTPPSKRIALDEFETFAVERLKALRKIEDIINMGTSRESDLHAKMREIVKGTHLGIWRRG